MEFELIRGMQGSKKFNLIIFRGLKKDYTRYDVSRMLTGTTNEKKEGIFTQGCSPTVRFFKEENWRDFKFGKLDLLYFSKKEIEEELRIRVEKVKKWSESIGYKETLKIKIL